MAKIKRKLRPFEEAFAGPEKHTDAECMGFIRKIRQAKKLMARIEACKANYQKLDALVQSLAEAGFESETADGETWVLKDNFAESNVVFRAHAMRRFELQPASKGKRKSKK